MKSKNIALVLSTVLLTNTVGFSAYANNSASATKIDESLIDQSLTSQSADMKRNLEQVNALIKSIETYRTASQGEKQNAFVNSARLMITLLGLGSTAVHLKNVQAQSSIELTLAAVAGVLSTALEKYVSSQKIDMNEIRSLLAANQQNLVNSISGSVSKEDAALISGAVAQLAQINSELDSRMNDIKRNIDSGQTDLAIVAVVTLVLNYAAPFLPKKLKDIVSNKVPTVLGHAAKTKKQGMQALGGTNIATLLSTMAGMAGKDSQAQLDTILSNLRVTQANLKAALK
ncbi:MAG: hypothetical protein ABL930_13540 [Pseudobdellovibrio sp.]